MSKKGARKSGSKKVRSNGDPAPTPLQRKAVPSALAERLRNAVDARAALQSPNFV